MGGCCLLNALLPTKDDFVTSVLPLALFSCAFIFPPQSSACHSACVNVPYSILGQLSLANLAAGEDSLELIDKLLAGLEGADVMSSIGRSVEAVVG